jgi:hypothetical protein
VPFTIVVTELGLPEGSSHVDCTWEGDHLRHHKPVYEDASAKRKAMAERVEMLDGGLPLRDVEWDESMSVSTNAERPLGSARFDDRLEPMDAPLEHDSRARRTYQAALLCANEDRVALLVDYVDAPLDAEGLVMVFARAGDRWQLVNTIRKWVA